MSNTPNIEASSWRLLIYMAADNDLRQRALQQLDAFKAWSLACAPAVGNLEVIVHADIAGEATQVLRIARGSFEVLTSDGRNQNSGAQDVLRDFIATYALTPASRYVGLIIWNHGGGWDLIAQDDTSADHLDNFELRGAIAEAMPARKLDLLGCDACLMSMVEVAHELRSVASIFIAAEGLAKAGGWPYEALFDLLDTGAPPDVASMHIVREFERLHATSTGFGTLSAITLDRIGALSRALDELGAALEALDERTLVRAARRRMVSLYNAAHVDLGAMIDQLVSALEAHDLTPGRQRCEVALEAVQRALRGGTLFVDRAHFGVERQRSGLSLFFPERYLTRTAWQSYDDLSFEMLRGWSSFLRWFLELPSVSDDLPVGDVCADVRQGAPFAASVQ